MPHCEESWHHYLPYLAFKLFKKSPPDCNKSEAAEEIEELNISSQKLVCYDTTCTFLASDLNKILSDS